MSNWSYNWNLKGFRKGGFYLEPGRGHYKIEVGKDPQVEPGLFLKIGSNMELGKLISYGPEKSGVKVGTDSKKLLRYRRGVAMNLNILHS